MTLRITYSTLTADMTSLHQDFDRALTHVRAGLGKRYPGHVGYRETRGGPLLVDLNPSNTREVLGEFHQSTEADVNAILELGKSAAKRWGAVPWPERVAQIRKAADGISKRRMEFATVLVLEAGKSRLEALGDVEEAGDLLRYYATQLEENSGFVKALERLSPQERTQSVLRPYGVFLVISPFNFPAALAAGMTGGALLGGNAVVLKPSEDTPWSAHLLLEIFRDAGLPEGVFQVAHGPGETVGAMLASDKRVDGIAFTGSTAVGRHLMEICFKPHQRPCLCEMGGKNPLIIGASADLTKAVQGAARSAFGLSGQKCSALSRIYIHRSREEEFLERFIEHTKSLNVGEPSQRDVFTGPVINAAAVERAAEAVKTAAAEGGLKHVTSLSDREELAHGHFVGPTIARLPHTHPLMTKELFLPFVGVCAFDRFEDAIAYANDIPYGLTAGVFSEDPQEVESFFSEVDAGVLYANRAAGATTGAWPGVQSFCGWKSSGSTGKGGCGPYYVMQFMREQSHTQVGG